MYSLHLQLGSAQLCKVPRQSKSRAAEPEPDPGTPELAIFGGAGAGSAFKI